MITHFWESAARHPIVCLGCKLLFSLFLVFALVQAALWALADIYYREFKATFRQLVISAPGTPEFTGLALKANNQLRRSIALAPSSAVYKRARGQLDRHLQSLGVKRINLPNLKPDAKSEFISAARRSPTWEIPYLDLAQFCSQQTPLSFETYTLKCQPLIKTATFLNPTYAYLHEQWASSLLTVIAREQRPSPQDISRVCREFGQALNLKRSGELWKRAFVTCSALTREYRFLRLLNPSLAREWSDLAAALAQDDVELWHQAKDDFLADLGRENHPLETYLAIAETLAKLGFGREGEWVLSRYLAMKPGDANAWISLISLVETYGLDVQKKEIKQMVTRALASADYEALAWVYFARILFKNGYNRYSTEVFRQVLARNPLSSSVYLELGDLLTKTDALQGARLAYQKSVELQPNNMSAWVRLGINLAKQGEYQLAVQKLEEALSLDPNNAKVKKALRQIGVF